MEQDIRWKQRLENYRKALERLESAAALSTKRPLSDLEQQGLIKAFEFTFELSWNVMKDYLTGTGISGIIGSKGAVREAFKNGLISDGENWMQMIADRNLAAHSYDEATAKKLIKAVLSIYLPLFDNFDTTMKKQEN